MRPARRRTLRRQQRAERGSRTAPLTGREIRGDVDGVIPVYRRMSGRQVAEGRFRRRNRGEHAILLHRSERFGSGVPSTPTGQSQLWKLHFVNRRYQAEVDSASFGDCTLSIGASRAGRTWAEARNPGRSPLSPRPRPLLSAWAQSRTGTPDAEDGRGQSSGPGCEAHDAPFHAALCSALAIPASPSPGDWSVVSAPTRSPLCGLPRLIGFRLSQESVHNRNAE